MLSLEDRRGVFSRRVVGGDAEVCDLERNRLGPVAHLDRDCVAASSVAARSDDRGLAVVFRLRAQPADDDTVAGRKGGLGPLELVHERHALGERLGRRAAVRRLLVAAVVDYVADATAGAGVGRVLASVLQAASRRSYKRGEPWKPRPVQ